MTARSPDSRSGRLGCRQTAACPGYSRARTARKFNHVRHALDCCGSRRPDGPRPDAGDRRDRRRGAGRRAGGAGLGAHRRGCRRAGRAAAPTASSCRPISGRCRTRPTASSISPCRRRPSPMSRSRPSAASSMSSAPPGLSASDDAVIKSVTKRAVVMQSGNMSLGVNLLAALVKRVAQSLDDDFRHRDPGDAPQGQGRCALGHRADARARPRRRPRHCAR